ncbi:mCG126966, partial [Mus musculus]
MRHALNSQQQQLLVSQVSTACLYWRCIPMALSCDPDMISTRVMDIKLREAAEGLGEDGAGKKKSKFKTFKKLFG